MSDNQQPTTENSQLTPKEQFQREYQAGKVAFERGQYRMSIERLEAAKGFVMPQTRQGGEVKIWLATAYQAANRTSEAISLCQQLTQHPHWEIRKQGKRLLDILKAPALRRPKEWITEIPNLENLSESEAKPRSYSRSTRQATSKPSRQEPKVYSPGEINTKDNQFIWAALIAILLILGGLAWLAQA